MVIRGEKVPANPIPEERYEQFKYRLEEISGKFKERNMMLFYLGVATGYRMQDLVKLTIGEIVEALNEGQFSIQEQKQYNAYLNEIKRKPNTKKKKPKRREVYIKKGLRKLLKQYCKDKPKSAYAFESNKGGTHIEAKSYSLILARTGKSLGLKNISGHSLRKVYATRIWESTRDLEFVRRAIGHTKIDTTKNYLGLEEEVIDRAADIADSKL